MTDTSIIGKFNLARLWGSVLILSAIFTSMNSTPSKDSTTYKRFIMCAIKVNSKIYIQKIHLSEGSNSALKIIILNRERGYTYVYLRFSNLLKDYKMIKNKEDISKSAEINLFLKWSKIINLDCKLKIN